MYLQVDRLTVTMPANGGVADAGHFTADTPVEIGDGLLLHLRINRLTQVHARHFFRGVAKHPGKGGVHILEDLILDHIHPGQGLLDDAAKGNVGLHSRLRKEKKGARRLPKTIEIRLLFSRYLIRRA